MSVCSAHQEIVSGCPQCAASPAMVLGITEEQWDKKMAAAEAAGLATCRVCNFLQYRNHRACMKCNADWWDIEAAPRGLCASREDHEPHIHDSGSLGVFWCHADQSKRVPFAAEKRRETNMNDRSRC